MTGILGSLHEAAMITGFVIVMMLLIEYINILTRGAWEERLRSNKWGQYLVAVLLGSTPGCLGAFAIVAMYSHRSVSLGAVVAAMVSTSGDEAFVMLAMIPKDAIVLFAILALVGFVAGALTDAIASRYASLPPAVYHALEVHEEEICHCFPRGQILRQWKECVPARGVLAIGLVLFLIALISGSVGPSNWNWIRVTLLVTCGATLFIVSTVPDHFLEEHLWRHVVLTHAPRVFLWTFGALLTMYILVEHLQVEETLRQGKWFILLAACLVGLVPESGPHLIFVTLYAQETVPFGVLLANSIVQDGHGMLPVLADSRKGFFVIKGINLLAALIVGAIAMFFSY
jgi:hypothetical protein